MSEANYLLGQKVFQIIREDIIAGKYRQREELREIAIGDELQVSRTPVREALRQLELEGLVTIVPNRGAYVVGISCQDMKDMFEIRLLLEGFCAGKAAKSATSEQLEALEEVMVLTEYHIKKGHFRQLVGLDNKFHEILYEAGGSRILEHALKNYHYYLKQARRFSLLSQGRASSSVQEHRRILEAVKAQDQKKAEDAVCQHLIHTIKNIDTYGWENISGGQKNGKN
ncbi:MAG: GntR family transcriptional regulator [Lachnospiraceae bacterium]|nr:GntR family transcriptional regulator [Lachnospiraceae bacterium]